MRFALSESFMSRHRLLATCGASCALLVVDGCNAVAGIDVPTDKPVADAAQDPDAREAAGEAVDATVGDDGQGGAGGRAIEAGSDGQRDGAPGAPDADGPRNRCAESSQSFRDPNTGIVWTPVWYCGNRGGAAVFESAGAGTQIGRMNTVMSWFVCYRHGDRHPGGNDVWYYTQGDEALPGWESRHMWGYMAAVDVYTSTDPFPGIVECTANP